MFISLLKTLARSYLSSALFRLSDCLRRIMLFVVAVIISAMMCCVSIFAGIAYLICQHNISGNFIFDGFLIFCSIVFAISLLVFLKLMCKRNFIRILGAQSLYQSNSCSCISSKRRGD